MNTKMYVGNLSFNSTEQDLRDLFGSHGEVTEVFIPTDRESGRPRGFAFVTMDSTDSMNDAISALNGNEFQGRPLVVNEAKPQANTGGRRWRRLPWQWRRRQTRQQRLWAATAANSGKIAGRTFASS